ncbi:MAG: amidohydrolase family protein, partial [Pseudomonadota bacterium]
GFQETERGTIEVGKQADLTAFDVDFLLADPQEILGAKTLLTVVGGLVSHREDDLPFYALNER